MDALQLLTADHNRVRGLFTRFRAAHEAEDTAQMALLAAKIFEELEVHTTIEEEIFYPAVKPESSEITETVDEGVQEHHVVKMLMQEMQQLEAGSDDWTAKMTVLIENVEHHADEEESDLFPSVRSATSEETRTSLGQRLETRKASLGAPTTADTVDLTKEELMAKAREQEIPGRSSMNREELAATVDPR
jgi:hemerythrin superfamily protein